MSEPSEHREAADADVVAGQLIEKFALAFETGRLESLPMESMASDALQEADPHLLVNHLAGWAAAAIGRWARAEGRDLIDVLDEMKEHSALVRYSHDLEDEDDG